MSDWICRNICFLASQIEYLDWVKAQSGKSYSQTIRDLINEAKAKQMK